MAYNPGHQVVVDPFGQALEGYRDGVKDSYDRALKGVQLQHMRQRIAHAASAEDRAAEQHRLNNMLAEQKLIKDECDRLKLPIVSIACVAVGLIDFNPSVQRFHVERVKKYLDLAYEYEAKNVLLVLGEYIWNQEVIPPEEQWKTGVKNCRILGDYAADLGVHFRSAEIFRGSLLSNRRLHQRGSRQE